MRKIIKSVALALVSLFTVITTPLTAKASLLSVENPSAVAYYNMLPDIVKYKMEVDGVNILVDSNSVAMLDPTYSTVGLTRTTTRHNTNNITSQAIFVKNGYEDAILHEAGHYMEGYHRQFKYWTYNDAWYNIYASEINQGVAAGMSDTNVYNQCEYFAEAFALYITNPNALATYCPMTYQYINAVVLAP